MSLSPKRMVAAAAVGAFMTLAASGCHDGLGPVGETTVLSVVPAGGATNVDRNGAIVVEFSHPMRMGMEQYAALHEGDVTGPVVPGAWSWSSGGQRLTFTPSVPLEPQTQYALHLGGGMLDAIGNLLNYDHCTSQHGGQWATRSMMGGSMMGGSMMGTGWQHANGTYGMVFVFTTA